MKKARVDIRYGNPLWFWFAVVDDIEITSSRASTCGSELIAQISAREWFARNMPEVKITIYMADKQVFPRESSCST